MEFIIARKQYRNLETLSCLDPVTLTAILFSDVIHEMARCILVIDQDKKGAWTYEYCNI